MNHPLCLPLNSKWFSDLAQRLTKFHYLFLIASFFMFMVAILYQCWVTDLQGPKAMQNKFAIYNTINWNNLHFHEYDKKETEMQYTLLLPCGELENLNRHTMKVVLKLHLQGNNFNALMVVWVKICGCLQCVWILFPASELHILRCATKEKTRWEVYLTSPATALASSQ